MKTFTGPVEAFTALQDFLIDREAALPELLRDEMRDVIKERSPVASVVRAVEAVYARQRRKSDVPQAMLDWAAGAAAMTEDHGFHEMDKDGRGSKMAKVLRGQSIPEKSKPLEDDTAANRMDPSPKPAEPAAAPGAETAPVDPAAPAQ